MLRVTSSKLREISSTALSVAGVPRDDALRASEVLVAADLMGIDTHGTRRLPAYIARIHDGAFNPDPSMKIIQGGQSSAVVDGDDGLGQVVGSRALELALGMAAETGVAYVGCRNSQHFGALAPYARLAAIEGMVCILGTNAFMSMAPWGGSEVRLGNNPIGIGAPRRGGKPHFILDIAMSVAARGKMRKAMERGEQIPPGWALDIDGKPTTDPLKGMEGFVLPIGGHKGYGLALMVDILAGILGGGAIASEINSLFKQKYKPQRVSHFFIAINPALLMEMSAYFERMEVLCDLMKNTLPFEDENPVLVPGEIEEENYQDRSENGIPVTEAELDALQSLAKGGATAEIATI